MHHQPHLRTGQTEKAKKAALILSSGSDDVYGGAIYEYQNSFLDYLKLEDKLVDTLDYFFDEVGI